MEKKCMNKYFIDVICNKVWSSFELLSEVNHQRKEEEKEKVLRVTFYHSVCGGKGLEEGLGFEGEWIQYGPFGGSQPTEWGLIYFPSS